MLLVIVLLIFVLILATMPIIWHSLVFILYKMLGGKRSYIEYMKIKLKDIY